MHSNACHLPEQNNKVTERPDCIAPIAIINTLCDKQQKMKITLHIEDNLLFALCN